MSLLLQKKAMQRCRLLQLTWHIIGAAIHRCISGNSDVVNAGCILAHLGWDLKGVDAIIGCVATRQTEWVCEVPLFVIIKHQSDRHWVACQVLRAQDGTIPAQRDETKKTLVCVCVFCVPCAVHVPVCCAFFIDE